MAKVNFKRIEDSSTINDIDIEDGAFIVTGDGKTYIDFGTDRIPTSGTPDSQMSNISRNTVENKVIKEYVDSNFIISPELLWSNPNPESPFDPQNITLSSSDYDVLEIYYYDWVDTHGFKDLICQKTIKGYGTMLQMQFPYNSAVFAGSRRIAYVDDTTLYIGDNVRTIDSSGFNTTTFNKWNVPIFIIGYKTGLTFE